MINRLHVGRDSAKTHYSLMASAPELMRNDDIEGFFVSEKVYRLKQGC